MESLWLSRYKSSIPPEQWASFYATFPEHLSKRLTERYGRAARGQLHTVALQVRDEGSGQRQHYALDAAAPKARVPVREVGVGHLGGGDGRARHENYENVKNVNVRR